VESRHLDALARGRKVNALAAALGDTEASLTGNALGGDARDAGAAEHVSRILQGYAGDAYSIPILVEVLP
jgi:hypothetical protein